jgi:uncharacterized protein YlzI (FlbEa/FlbD family)
MLMINYKEALPEEFHFKVMQKWNGKKNVKEEGEEEVYKKISHCGLLQYRLLSFQAGGTKLERFLHQIQHTQRK